MRELSVSEQSRLRALVAARQHPDRIEAYLKELAFSTNDIEQVYTAANLRRSHLLACYRMKRNVRLIGGLVILSAVSVPIFDASGTTIVISLGLLVYGIALAITGSMTVYQA
jgi:hypothetical protein